MHWNILFNINFFLPTHYTFAYFHSQTTLSINPSKSVLGRGIIIFPFLFPPSFFEHFTSHHICVVWEYLCMSLPFFLPLSHTYNSTWEHCMHFVKFLISSLSILLEFSLSFRPFSHNMLYEAVYMCRSKNVNVWKISYNFCKRISDSSFLFAFAFFVYVIISYNASFQKLCTLTIMLAETKVKLYLLDICIRFSILLDLYRFRSLLYQKSYLSLSKAFS